MIRSLIPLKSQSSIPESGSSAIRGKTVGIGVFVCGCSGNISNHIDTDKVAKEAETLDDVSYVGRHDVSMYFRRPREGFFLNLAHLD